MARPLRIQYPGALYHIIQRGNERRDIFLSDEDIKKFYGYLETSSIRYAIKIHTYCLMRNHYHLIVQTKEANLTKAMHFLNTSYTAYFNAKRKRAGHLFQGRYKAFLVEADEYLHYLSAYIHLNPVRVNMVKDPSEYAHSSYKYFISTAKAPDWLDANFILTIFDDNIKKAKLLYKKFVMENMGRAKEIIQENIIAGLLLGSKDFVEQIKERFIENKTDQEIPVLNKLRNRADPVQIREMVEKKINNPKLSRNIAIYLIRKHTPSKLKDIAAMYDGIGDAGVSALFNRIKRKREENKKFRELIGNMEKVLKIET